MYRLCRVVKVRSLLDRVNRGQLHIIVPLSNLTWNLDHEKLPLYTLLYIGQYVKVFVCPA